MNLIAHSLIAISSPGRLLRLGTWAMVFSKRSHKGPDHQEGGATIGPAGYTSHILSFNTQSTSLEAYSIISALPWNSI